MNGPFTATVDLGGPLKVQKGQCVIEGLVAAAAAPTGPDVPAARRRAWPLVILSVCIVAAIIVTLGRRRIQ